MASTIPFKNLNRDPETVIRNARLREEHKRLLRRFYEAFLRPRGLAPNSARQYVMATCWLLSFLERQGVSAKDGFTEADLKDFIVGLSRQVSDSSMRVFAAGIRRFLEFMAEETGDERYAEMKGLSVFKAKRPKTELPETLSREEIEKILDCCGDLETKTLIALVYETGARIQEILRLRRRDIVFDEYGARLRLWHSKSESRVVRVVKYSKLLALYLETARPGEDEYIFRHSYTTYLDRFRKVCERAGVRWRHRMFHVLRHTRATELYRHFRELEMMRWFGWKTRAMIDVYSRVTQEDVEQRYLQLMGLTEKKEERREEMVKCPRCGDMNPANASFCYRCGMPLKPELAVREEVELRRELDDLKKKLEALMKELEKKKKEVG